MLNIIAKLCMTLTVLIIWSVALRLLLALYGFLTESLCNDSYVSVVNPLIAPYSLIDAII